MTSVTSECIFKFQNKKKPNVNKFSIRNCVFDSPLLVCFFPVRQSTCVGNLGSKVSWLSVTVFIIAGRFSLACESVCFRSLSPVRLGTRLVSFFMRPPPKRKRFVKLVLLPSLLRSMLVRRLGRERKEKRNGKETENDILYRPWLWFFW